MYKRGECPQLTGEATHCTQECVNDGHCSGSAKCCYNGCSYSCLEPVSDNVQTSAPDTYHPGSEYHQVQSNNTSIFYVNVLIYYKNIITFWSTNFLLSLWTKHRINHFLSKTSNLLSPPLTSVSFSNKFYLAIRILCLRFWQFQTNMKLTFTDYCTICQITWKTQNLVNTELFRA